MNTTTMNGILSILEKAEKVPHSELSFNEQTLKVYKFILKNAILNGEITDVEKAEKWLELIEIVCEWNANPIKDEEPNKFHYDLNFYGDGSVSINCSGKNYHDQFQVDFVNGELIMEGKKIENIFGSDFPDVSTSINTLMNLIEFDLTINCN